MHGFLGRPTDWNDVKADLPQSENIRIYTPDYFKEPELNPHHTFDSFAENYTNWVLSLGCASDVNVLVGYSLGGRLALHVFDKNPSLWKKIICISANPGFEDQYFDFNSISDERRTRWLNDSKWAEEFFKNSWDKVMEKWNAQTVFAGGKGEPLRLEKDYSKEALSLALTQWSLAQQKNMRDLLKNNGQKVLWLAGEKDEKFVAISNKLKLEIPELDLKIIPKASHRILFDNPQAVSQILNEQMGRIFNS